MVDATRSLPVKGENRLPVFGTFGTTFRIFGAAPLQFLALSLLTAVPTVIYLALFHPGTTKFTLTTAIYTLIGLLVNYFLQIPMTYVAARLFDGETVSTGAALKSGARRYLPVLGAALLTMLLVYGGLVLLVVPGLIFACVYAVTLPVCVLEGLGPIASMKRSAALTKYNRWRILGVYVLFFLPLMIVSGAIAALLTMRGNVLLGQWITMAIQIVWVPLATIFAVAIYVGLRRLKENVGVASVFD